MSGILLAVLGFGTMGTAWALWWRRIQTVHVPREPHAFRLAHVAALVLAVAGVFVSGGLVTIALAVLTVFGSGMWLFFSATSAMDHKIPSVKVGDAILDFTALDADGNSFALTTLRGQPFLLKFFRGFW